MNSYEIKSEDIRELVRLLKLNIETDDLKLSKIEDDCQQLIKLKNIIKSYEDQMQSIVDENKVKEEKVVVFDGIKKLNFDVNEILREKNSEEAKLYKYITTTRK